MITQNNFHLATTANFTEIRFGFLGDSQPDYISKSGSQYWYDSRGVYRISNHWGGSIATCSWYLNGTTCNELKLGFCAWSDFYKMNSRLGTYNFSLDSVLEQIKSENEYSMNKARNGKVNREIKIGKGFIFADENTQQNYKKLPKSKRR